MLNLIIFFGLADLEDWESNFIYWRSVLAFGIHEFKRSQLVCFWNFSDLHYPAFISKASSKTDRRPKTLRVKILFPGVHLPFASGIFSSKTMRDHFYRWVTLHPRRKKFHSSRRMNEYFVEIKLLNSDKSRYRGASLVKA